VEENVAIVLTYRMSRVEQKVIIVHKYEAREQTNEMN
jgi:hypothetical protein